VTNSGTADPSRPIIRIPSVAGVAGFGGRERDGRPRLRVPHVKNAVPRLPATFVPRVALREAVDRETARADVTLVCAPAGYGKTLLLADWVGATGDADKAWVSVDGDDNQADRFFAAVLGAIRACAMVPPESRLHDLAAPYRSGVAGFLAELVDAIQVLPGTLSLVLDGIHDVVDADTVHGLTTLIRHQPGNLRIVLTSRWDPAVPLARLRVQGRLAEIRASRLRCSAEEAGKLVRAEGAELDEEQLRLLLTQTGGWLAGLVLAARSLRDTPDPELFLAGGAGSDPAIADYLAGEVLARLPGGTRHLLRAISVCDGVHPGLARLLSGRVDAGAVLAGLERERALLEVDETQSYRVNPLLRQHLRADLTRRLPGLVAELHGVAARWFATEGRPVDALRHAERTGDQRDTVKLLRRHAVEILVTGNPEPVLRGLAVTGAPAVAGDSWLSLCSALAHLQLGDLTAAESDLAHGDAAWPDPAEDTLTEFRRLVVSAHALACGRHPPVVPGSAVGGGEIAGLEALTWLYRGMSRAGDGDRPGARAELAAADQLAREQGLDYLVLHGRTALAVMSALDGDFAEMEAACAEALAIAEGTSWQHSQWLAPTRAMLALARLLRLEPGAALDLARQVADAEPVVVRFVTDLVTGAARFDQGQRVVGARLLQRARRDLGDWPLPPEVVALAALTEHHCAVLLANHPLAHEIAEWAVARVGETGEAHLMAARTRFARGDFAFAESALREGLGAGAPPPLSGPLALVEAKLLEAAIATQTGGRTRARSALKAALTLGEPGGVIRPFEYADAPVRRLLLDQIGGFGEADAFACRVRRVLATIERADPNGVLTEREHAVLARLTSPQPLDEVASDLLVSVNTVKTHVRAIYAKLGVNNRRAAVMAAREMGLT
jgi:LuxR family maltose regulon positive regulatory protein